MALAGQRIVLVGGSSGIGLATAKAAVALHARVLIAGRSAERLAQACEATGAAVETGCLDATREEEVAAFFDQHGGFDHLAVLVPSAPSKEISEKLGPFLKTATATVESVFRNKFWSQYFCARYGAPHVAVGGSITFVSATTPRKAIPGYSATAAANGAVEALANTLALELAPVRVNVVAPGFVATELIKTLPPDRRTEWNRLAKRQPVKRMARPEEIADAILFLMGNAFVTGEILQIDGGYKYT